MKKSISLVLCLVMLISVFSCLGVTASAVDASDLFTIEKSSVKNNKVTYTVYLNEGVKVSGAVIYAKFDPGVLSIDKANSGAYMVDDGDGGERENVGGMYEHDFMEGYKSQYSIAHAYGQEADYKVGSSRKPYMKFTFKTTSANRPATTVKFYCHEFYSMSTPKNNITNGSKALIYSKTLKTLGQTSLNKAYTRTSGVKISWDKTTGADGYYVYKKVDGSYTRIKEIKGASKTTFTDKDVKNNKTYTYTVRAFNESGINDSYNKTGVSVKYMVPTASVKAKIGVNSITVSWSKVAGATAYRLYRRVVNADGTKGSWKSFSKTKALSKTDSVSLSSGKTYEYAVRTYSGSSYSVLSKATAIDYIATPKVTAKSVYDGVKVSWDKVSGAQKYRVYRKVYGASSWTAIATVGKDARSYVDTAASNNKKIYYTVKAIGADSVSAYKAVSVQYIKAPKASVSNVKAGVKVSWGKISGATEYYVYRKAGSASSWTKIATVTSTSYIDKNVKNNTTYKYTVRAANSTRTSGYYSDGWKTKFFSAPKLVSVASSSKGITFKWEKISGATQYYVYRKTGSGSFQRLALVSGNSTVSYVDKTAQKGKTYTYTVRASNGTYHSYYNTGLKITDKY